jgi:hypothetical protein|tara:strand:- start:1295 stop:1771 length:477 start_codon:yes stop_codon:yes gene_type:complete
MPFTRTEEQKEQRKINYKNRTEEQKQRDREYTKTQREKNKDNIKLTQKNYHDSHKEERKEYNKKNREHITEYHRQYIQTDLGKKINRIGNWKNSGVISDNYDELYELYINCSNCENCGVNFEEKNCDNRKCLDHSHTTGVFRNILCARCNKKRGEGNL